jgi:hypothetical protein
VDPYVIIRHGQEQLDLGEVGQDTDGCASIVEATKSLQVRVVGEILLRKVVLQLPGKLGENENLLLSRPERKITLYIDSAPFLASLASIVVVEGESVDVLLVDTNTDSGLRAVVMAPASINRLEILESTMLILDDLVLSLAYVSSYSTTLSCPLSLSVSSWSTVSWS